MPCPCRGHSTPCAGIGKATVPANSPSMAQACVQSNGVLALHPINGVRSRPPRRASAGSSGTAVVARKLALLVRSSATQSSGDLLSRGLSMRLDLCAREWLASDIVTSLVAVDGMSAPCVCSGTVGSWAMSISSGRAGV